MNSEDAIRKVCRDLESFLLEKNRSYGDSFRRTGEIWKSSPIDRIKIRIEDKLARLRDGGEYKGDDTELDLLGYFALLRVLRNLERDSESTQVEMPFIITPPPPPHGDGGQPGCDSTLPMMIYDVSADTILALTAQLSEARSELENARAENLRVRREAGIPSI